MPSERIERVLNRMTVFDRASDSFASVNLLQPEVKHVREIEKDKYLEKLRVTQSVELIDVLESILETLKRVANAVEEANETPTKA